MSKMETVYSEKVSMTSPSMSEFRDAINSKYSKSDAMKFQRNVNRNFAQLNEFQANTLDNFEYIDEIRSMTWQIAGQYGSIIHKAVEEQRAEIKRSSKLCLIVLIFSFVAMCLNCFLILNNFRDSDQIVVFGIILCLVALFCSWVSSRNMREKLFLDSVDDVACDVVDLSRKLKAVDDKHTTKETTK